MTVTILEDLYGHLAAMTPDEALLMDRDLLGAVVRALELHSCRGALVQALDRLEKVQAYREGKARTLPATDAAINLLRHRIGQADRSLDREAAISWVQDAFLMNHTRAAQVVAEIVDRLGLRAAEPVDLARISPAMERGFE